MVHRLSICNVWAPELQAQELLHKAQLPGILDPCSGIKPTFLTLKAWDLNHWTTREVTHLCFIAALREGIVLSNYLLGLLLASHSWDLLRGPWRVPLDDFTQIYWTLWKQETSNICHIAMCSDHMTFIDTFKLILSMAVEAERWCWKIKGTEQLMILVILWHIFKRTVSIFTIICY